ncbi:MAG: 4Fe-4S binding protein [Anaerolineales bacterium]
MPRILSLLHLLPQLCRTLRSEPITVRFPFGEMELPSYYRGQVVVDPDLCRGCGLCARDCPAAALELQREGRDKYRLVYYPARCAYCGQCEESCPADALTLINEYEKATPQQDTPARILVDRDEDSSTD